MIMDIQKENESHSKNTKCTQRKISIETTNNENKCTQRKISIESNNFAKNEIIDNNRLTSENASNLRQFAALAPCILLSLCYGTNSAFVALLTPQLREDCSEFYISADQESWIVSLDNLFTPVVCILSGPIQHLIGPRLSIQVSCLPYITAWAITLLATDYKFLYLARLLVGISHALSTTTIYSVEILSNQQRGPFDVIISSFRAVGSTFVFSLGLLFRWTTIAKIVMGIPVLAFVLSFLIPESPVYLISKGKEANAEKSMRRLYGKHFDTQQKSKKIKNNLASIANRQHGNKLNYILEINKHAEVYKPFLIVMLLSIVQIFSGASALRGYVIKIFDSVLMMDDQINTNTDVLINNSSFILSSECVKENEVHLWAYLSGIIIGIFRFAGTIFLASKLKKYKRRNMYMLSMVFSITGLLLFSLFSFLKEYHAQQIYGWLSLASACFLVSAVQLGVQTLPFLYSSELFPADIRAICKSTSRAMTTLMLLGTLKVFPSLVSWLSLPGTFLMYGIVLAVFCPLMYFILPETKDLELEKMHGLFRKLTVVKDEASPKQERNSISEIIVNNNNIKNEKVDFDNAGFVEDLEDKIKTISDEININIYR